MAGEELGTSMVAGLQNMPPDYLRYLQWLQSQQGAQPQAPNAYALPQQPAPPPAFSSAPNVSGRVDLNVRPVGISPEAEAKTPLFQRAQPAPLPDDGQPSLTNAPDTARSRLRSLILGNERSSMRQGLADRVDTIADFTPLGNVMALQEARSPTDVALATVPPVAGKVGKAAQRWVPKPQADARLGSGPILPRQRIELGAPQPPPTTGDVISSSILEPRTASSPRAMTPQELERGALWSHTEQKAPVQPIEPGDTRVSTRFPTGAGATEDPLRQHLSIGSDEMRLVTPNKKGTGGFEHNVNLLRGYPGFERLKNMDDLQAVQEYLKQTSENLAYLHERSPQVMKDRSPLWYEGANQIADALAQRWGIPRRSASAMLASLSPQMDWFKNASLGERLGDIMTSAAAGRPMTQDMIDYAHSRMGTKDWQYLKPGSENLDIFRAIRGKTLDELTDPLEKAMWIRMYDEAHNPRPYRSVTPEGAFGEYMTKGTKGELRNVGWGSFNEIEKAVRAMESGGNMDLISELLGNKHKVRSFYNNIERPNDPRFGDITADTHAVAAAQMRPLSGKSAAVSHNLASGSTKGQANTSSSDISGVQGTYGWTADATRRFADEAGMLPRAAQSATWEPVRTLFTDTWKRGKQPGGQTNPAAVDAIWRQFDAGEITAQQARDRIYDLAGGIKEPEWARRGLETTPANKGSTYR